MAEASLPSPPQPRAQSGPPSGRWSAPSAEALEAHLAAHPPRPPSKWMAYMPLMVLGGAIAISLFVPGYSAWLLPWAALVGLAVYGGQRLGAMQRIEARVRRVQELAMLRHHRMALRGAWRLVAQLSAHPLHQHRVIAVMAHCLDDLAQHRAAWVAYDRLLADVPHTSPGAVLLRIQRAIAELFTDRLTDADATLRALRGPIENLQHTPIDAAYHFALLLQSVRTAHYAEAIEETPSLVEALRPLGVEAGFGHALRAFCHRQRDEPQQARDWWDRATTLLPETALIQRIPELEAMRRD